MCSSSLITPTATSAILASSRFCNDNNIDLSKNYHSPLLSTKITGSEISVFPDCYIEKIQLNIFPQTASYSVKSTMPSMAQSKCKYNNNNYIDNSQSENFLSIDVHEKYKPPSVLSEACCENNEKPIGNFSHISFKRSDSILHISIGNSSKIVKRNKRKRRWFLNKLCTLSRRSKKENNQIFFSPQYECKEGKEGSVSGDKGNGIYHLNGNMDAFNVVNDTMIITINKKNGLADSKVDNDAHHDTNQLFGRDLDYGANELDFYMNEVRKREYHG